MLSFADPEQAFPAKKEVSIKRANKRRHHCGVYSLLSLPGCDHSMWNDGLCPGMADPQVTEIAHD
jgi:hypothetical protein